MSNIFFRNPSLIDTLNFEKLLDQEIICTLASKYINDNNLKCYTLNLNDDKFDLKNYEGSNKYIRGLKYYYYNNKEIDIFETYEELIYYYNKRKFYNYEFFIILNSSLYILEQIKKDYLKVFEDNGEEKDKIDSLSSLYVVIKKCQTDIFNLITKLKNKMENCKSKIRLKLFEVLIILQNKFGYFNTINKLLNNDTCIYFFDDIIEFTKEVIEKYFNSREKKYRKNRSKKSTKRQDREKKYFELLNSYEYRTKKISKRDIAKILEVSPAAVTQFCKRHGIP